MNENLIVQLALKASNKNTGWLDRQKFAELIVRECARLVEESKWNLPRGCTAVEQAKYVKDHFGVE